MTRPAKYAQNPGGQTRPGRLCAHFKRDENGAIAVMFALMLPVIIGMIAIGLEVGLWYQERRDMQTAADAAAIAAAFARAEGGDSEAMLTAATSEATRNGYDAANDTLTPPGTPTSGAYLGNSDYVEVIISHPMDLLFAQIIWDQEGVTTTTRAVASASVQSAGSACVLALDTSGVAVEVSGSGDVDLEGCQVASNSSNAGALTVSGSGDLDVDCYSVVGGVSDNGGLHPGEGCSGATGAAALDDPYAHLTDPDDGGCDQASDFTHNSAGNTVTLGNGSYVDPYVVCGDVWAQNGTIEFDGLVVIKGDIKSNANGDMISDATNGSTIVLKNGGQINNFNGSSELNLKAPSNDSAGDWKGILFFQDPDTTPSCTGNNCNTVNGNATSTFEGAMYFPDQQITFSGGNEQDDTCLQIVALRVNFTGNSMMNSDYDACQAAGVSDVTIPGEINVALVE